MLPLAGYADRLSARPGETLRFHVANTTQAPVTAKIVRVISADPNPAGPGIKLEAVAAAINGLSQPDDQLVDNGSWAEVTTDDRATPSVLTLIANIMPTKTGARQRVVMAWNTTTATSENCRLQIAIDPDGHLAAELVSGPSSEPMVLARAVLPLPLTTHAWHRVSATLDQTSQHLTISCAALGPNGALTPATRAQAVVGSGVTPLGNVDFIAIARSSGMAWRHAGQTSNLTSNLQSDTFDGRIEAPAIMGGAPGKEVLIAAWDFSRQTHTTRIIDTGPHSLHGTLINTPIRAVRGSTWTGREQCFRHAPDQYAAIHFHEDDLDDCHWPATHELKVPNSLRSGAYALMLEAGDARENIPFFVVPPKGKQTAKLAVLVSTFTYTVYGNHARPEWTTNAAWKEAWLKQAKDWNAYPHNPGAHTEYGLSTYNFHTDGSGIAMASWHRPMLNTRIGYFTYPFPDIRGSGLRHYPADSHLLAWLEAKGIAYDLITDWELHHEGVELLQRYTCITTGSHPEYHTTQMLDALEAYRDGGGRFMYLGGNGFYWKIALSPDKPGLIEIRRAEGGIRAWAAEPGEYYNQFDGEYGGLWRRNARPPQKLTGVGFTAQGNFVGSYYRVKDEARKNPRTAWIFDGINDEIIGGFGLSGHGAAGFELDRADTKLGTPAHAQIIAQSENHPPDAPWVLVPEEQLTHLTTFPGESHKQLIRADMTLFEAPNNGCVFSTGSITFCGSLPHNNFDNTVSTLLHNVLTRFLDPHAKFEISPAA